MLVARGLSGSSGGDDDSRGRLDDGLEIGDLRQVGAAVVHGRVDEGQAALARRGQAGRQRRRAFLRRGRRRRQQSHGRAAAAAAAGRRGRGGQLEPAVELEDAALEQEVDLELGLVLGLDGLELGRVLLLGLLQETLLLDELDLLAGVPVLELGQPAARRLELQALGVELPAESWGWCKRGFG